jgi:hypothetical protein
MALGTVRILGWLVIAHGLSHAVLPLRGSIAPTLSVDDWTPVVLYGVGMVGFVAAGLGLLGLRPLDRAISPLLVLASGLSLVAIVRFADPSLWFGAACDVALLIIGLWRAYGGWPMHPAHGRIWHVTGLMTGFALLLYVATVTFAYPWHRTWGSTREELAMTLPGDPEVRDRALEVQHAVTIAAPSEDVWRRIVQLAHERVAYSEPGRALVLENQSSYVFLPTADGQTRFIIRTRLGYRQMPVWESAINMMTFQLPHFIAERRMMLQIKEVAESRHAMRTARAR